MAGGSRKNADSALIAALAAGMTREAAAERAGVGVTTVYRRLADPDFQQQLDEARSEYVNQTVARLTAASTAAAATLLRLLDARSESVRLQAARSIIELGAQLRKTEEIEQRLAALEAQHAMKEPLKWRA